MPQPDQVAELAEQLIRLFTEAQGSLTDRLAAAATDGSRARLRELQRAVEATLGQLGTDAAAWLSGDLPVIYELGGDAGAASIGDSFTWSQFHVDAATELAQQTFTEVLDATSFVRANTKRWIRDQARRRTTSALLEGETAQQAARGLAREALARDVLSVTYRNGARHTIADYADTLVRTTSANAFNAGTLNHLTAAGVGFVEVIDGSDCGWTSHDDGDKANGTVRKVEDAMRHSLSHPRCRRSFAGRVDVTTDEQARAAKSLRTTEQMADQAAAEAERAQGIARRAATRRARSSGGARTRTPRAARTPRAPRQATAANVTPKGTQTVTGARFEPAGRMFRVDDAVKFEGKAGDWFADIAHRIGQVHDSVPVEVTVVLGGKTQSRGASYAPRKRTLPKPKKPSSRRSYDGGADGYRKALDEYIEKFNAYGRSPTRPVITINRPQWRGAEGVEAPISFLHEFGHHLDIQGTSGSRIRAVVRDMDPRITDPAAYTGPIERFLTSVRQTDAYRALTNRAYTTDPIELWARAYSQWAATTLGDDASIAALRAYQSVAPGFQWADDEFAEKVAPFVENILEHWGLMVRTA